MDGQAKAEEKQHLLSEEGGQGSEDEGSHLPPQPPKHMVYVDAEHHHLPKNARSSSPPPAYVCAQQQTVVRRPVQGNPPGDQFLMSLFTIFCCFMPLGVVALIKSVEARQAYQNGRLKDAVAATRTAKTFNKLSIMINLILLGFIICIYVFLFLIIANMRSQYLSEN